MMKKRIIKTNNGFYKLRINLEIYVMPEVKKWELFKHYTTCTDKD